MREFFSTEKASLYEGDCVEVLRDFPDKSFDLIFADPPYFLSGGGITCQNGKMVSVDKGSWDKAMDLEAIHEFNRAWLSSCRDKLTDNGTIFVSGTSHNIYSIGFALQELGFKVLNDISWFKVNPPPNLSCRYFTHSTEQIIWAKKDSKAKHKFNYDLMKAMDDPSPGKQMLSLWKILPPKKEEKKFGKHPTQKPLALLERIILAASSEGDHVLDPFVGSGTTGVASLRLGRRFVGIDTDVSFLDLAKQRMKAVSPVQEVLEIRDVPLFQEVRKVVD
jgi:site-specific DNA-methyltransferase (adenine-specific)